MTYEEKEKSIIQGWIEVLELEKQRQQLKEKINELKKLHVKS
jgi:hypothetical protein